MVLFHVIFILREQVLGLRNSLSETLLISGESQCRETRPSQWFLKLLLESGSFTHSSLAKASHTGNPQDENIKCFYRKGKNIFNHNTV